MEGKAILLFYLVVFASNNCHSSKDVNDVLGFDSPVRSQEWIDPDDMGMPSTNIGYSRKFSYNEDSSEFASPDSNIELNSLKNQIKSLNSIIDSLQQENLKLNKSCNLLHDKYINVSSLNNTENKDRKSESADLPSTGPMDSDRKTQHQAKGEELLLLRYIKLIARKLKLTTNNNERLPWKFENEDSRNQERVLRYIATLRLSEKDTKIIQSLARSQSSNISSQLYNIDYILSNLIYDVRHETSEEMEKALRIDYVAAIAYYLPSENDLMWIGAVTVFSCVSVLLYSGKMSYWKFIGFLFFVSSAWHWTRMYKKALTDKHITLSKSKQIPQECSPDSMSWAHYLMDSMFLQKDKCKEYYEALMIDPLLEVTPTMALAETFTAFVVQPMEHLGRHIGKFFNALLQEISWLSSPVILAFVFIAILLCLVMLFGYRFRLPFFLGTFEPKNNLSDSFAIERKEQQKMIVELKTTLNALKDVHTPKKQISPTRINTNITECSSLSYEKYVSDVDGPSNNEKSSITDNDMLKQNMTYENRVEHVNHRRSTSSPSKISAKESSDSQSLQCELNLVSKSIGVVKHLSTNDLFKSHDSNEIISDTKVEDFKEVKQIYQSPPNKKLVIKKSDRDPNDTDFEWVTEILGNKLDELQEMTDSTKKSCENTEIQAEEINLIEKAKDIFQDVLEDKNL